MGESSISLKPGRDRSVLARHPWIFASAIKSVQGNPGSGDTVLVLDEHGKRLALAAFSPQSQIRARIWTFNAGDVVDKNFLEKRILGSIERRKFLHLSSRTSAQRLVYGEADGLPGLIVDQYENNLVMQILSAGAEAHREEIIEILERVAKPDCIYERSDVDVRTLEGLQSREGLLAGNLKEDSVQIMENGISYRVDIKGGQKTGFYIDQRDNRQKVFDLAKDKSVLNCFCYTGGFSLNALAGGAKAVLSIDSSAPALETLDQNIKFNEFDETRSQTMEGDVFKLLRLFRDQARSFDLIILDPPKFAPTVSQVEKAARAYKDINLLAIKLLSPGGVLVTFSCSGGISRDLFQKIVAGAALDAGVDLRIVEQLSQSADHPVLLSFPESHYLKGLVCLK